MSTTDLLLLVESVYFKQNPRIRCEQTKRQYRYAIADLAAAIGQPPTTADLTDENVAAMMAWQSCEKKLAAKTINERRGRINALWTWLAKKGLVNTFPTTPPIPEPVRIPVAWSRSEIAILLEACKSVPGEIDGLPASEWWTTLHIVAWETGERIGALLDAEPSHLSGEWLTLPAEIRKGRKRDMQYKLTPETAERLRKFIALKARKKIWPWPNCISYLWIRYRNIRRRAGLPDDRKSGFHRIRKSVATHYEAAGGNATELLGHTSRALTVRSYLDPRFIQSKQAVDLLFKIDPPMDK